MSSVPEFRNSARPTLGYIYGLDALRFFAVSIVILRHYEIVPILPGGFGVSVFFFISGFLICRLLLAEEDVRGRIDVKRFYVRRFIRLLPPLMLMGIVCVPLLLLFYPESFSWIQVVLSFIYLGNVVKFGDLLWGWGEGLEALEPLWSLAVEEHFYLLLAPILVLARTFRVRLLVVLLAIVGPLILRIGVQVFASSDLLADEINYHFTLTRLDSMAWGVLVSLLLDRRVLRSPRRSWAGHLLIWGGALLMVLSMIHWSQTYEISIKYSVQGASIGVAIVGVLFAPNYQWLRSVLEASALVHLGRISYELYLWHFPVLAVCLRLQGPGPVTLALSIVCTWAVAEVAYRLTTKKLRPLRQKFGGHPVPE